MTGESEAGSRSAPRRAAESGVTQTHASAGGHHESELLTHYVLALFLRDLPPIFSQFLPFFSYIL